MTRPVGREILGHLLDPHGTTLLGGQDGRQRALHGVDAILSLVARVSTGQSAVHKVVNLIDVGAAVV